MKAETRAERAVRLVGRASGLVLFVLALSFWGASRHAAAQNEDDQAGLVIQFGDGSVYTACVDLGADGQSTGEELLRDSGLSVSIDFSSGYGDGTVCKVADEGCDFPGEKCFCQCTMRPGDPCVYWIYFHQEVDEWRYSIQGVRSHTVKAGDVEGWVWGAGSSQDGLLPPLITFDQICGTSEEPIEPTLESGPVTRVPPTQPVDTPVAEESEAIKGSVSATSAATPTTKVATLAASATPALDVTINQTPQASAQVAMRAADGSTSASVVQPSPTLSIQIRDQDSQSKTSYFVFGLLVVVLAGGLVYLRTR